MPTPRATRATGDSVAHVPDPEVLTRPCWRVTLAQWPLSPGRCSRLEWRAAGHAALSDVGRLRVIDSLEVGDVSPRDLAAALGMSSNLLAHHLKVLEAAGLVRRLPSESDGRRTYVRLVPEAWRRWAGSPSPPSRRRGSSSSARATPRARSWRPRSGPSHGTPGRVRGDAPRFPDPPGHGPSRPGPRAATARRPAGIDGRGPGLRGRDHHGVRLRRSRGAGRAHALVDPGPGPGRHDGRLRAHPGRSHQPDRRLGARCPDRPR